jgi:hypothetical protein
MKKAAQRIQAHHDHVQSFVKVLKQLSYRHSLHGVFSDFCEMSAISISNAVDRSQFETREARYLVIVKGYTRDELALFAQLLGIVVEALEDELQDFLGSCFMALELSNHWKGQFFTPYVVSKMMAMMTADVSEASIIRQGGLVKLNEPACGAGAMVIAYADAMREKGQNYQQLLHVMAQDLDPTAAHMCYIQLSLLHVPALVLIGNTLADEVREHWVTPAHVLGGWDKRLHQRRMIDALMELITTPQADEEVQADASEMAPKAAPLDQVRDEVVMARIEASEQMTLF